MCSNHIYSDHHVYSCINTSHSPLAAHSHKLLILAPIIEGSLGGWSTLTGANTAYIVDCTFPGSRATIFSRFTGVLCIGLALGPMLGAWLIRHPIPFLNSGNAEHPLQSVTSVFWVAIACSFVNLILVLFVFPESLPASRRASNRKGKGRAVESSPIFPISKADESSQGWVATRIIRRFLSPLAVFLPSHVPVAASATGDSLVPYRTRKDWGLTFIGLSLFSHMLASGIFQIKYLYAEHIYDWAAEQLSYYISFMGACRAWHLLVLLPFLLLKFKPVRAAVPATDAPANPAAPTSKPKPTKSHLFSEMQFDLRVVRYSMLIDFLSHALVVIAPLPSRGANDAWWSQFMFRGCNVALVRWRGVDARHAKPRIVHPPGTCACYQGSCCPYRRGSGARQRRWVGAWKTFRRSRCPASHRPNYPRAHALWCHLQQHHSLLPQGYFRNGQWPGTAINRVHHSRQARC
ncbi:hypothetical protein DEU56DRAFT_197986 [Suillus clintonianus]|uniref:uncharacterized protein n=1 Tax=Suillus clintonianus TaxID=1904413 RepID=UPI001B87C4CC|nr:uncharacterized protein DEU56DRAFT_197986 [Suillus clintonianus]KAG2145229.1 hypothetical protein DEU56DRAFT_197986 [Suillus clintonianus]